MLNKLRTSKTKNSRSIKKSQPIHNQDDLKTTYTTIYSPVTSKANEPIQTLSPMDTITLSNHTASQRLINTQRDNISTIDNQSISNHHRTKSLPNVVMMETLIEEMSSNVIDKRTLCLQIKLRRKSHLENSVNILTKENAIMTCELNRVKGNIQLLENIKESTMFEFERYHRQEFHQDVEKVFLKTKIKQIEDEISKIKEDTSNTLFMKNKPLDECGYNKEESKENFEMIKILMNDKKNLATALVYVNRKKIETEEKIKIISKSSEGLIKCFEKLVNDEKNAIYNLETI